MRINFSDKNVGIASIGIVIIMFTLVGISFFKGVGITLDNDTISLSGGIFYKNEVKYSDIKNMDLVEKIDIGTRTNGMSLINLQIGTYSNDEFGKYRLYIDTKVKKYIVLTCKDGQLIVFNDKSEDATADMYKIINEKIK